MLRNNGSSVMPFATFPRGQKEEIWGFQLEVRSHPLATLCFYKSDFSFSFEELQPGQSHPTLHVLSLLKRGLLWHIMRIKVGTIHCTLICYNCHLECLLLIYTTNETLPHGTDTTKDLSRREDLLSAASLLRSDRKLPGSRGSRPYPGAGL